ncbi:unnamed protein product [Lupinus luteus]|uniref:Uncharacterized protein n=1 Tax=Lupinus luteus TaxID=3873 RepID=A0AAV1X5D3_LUPLU
MIGLRKENKSSVTQDNNNVPASRRSKKENTRERRSVIMTLHVVGAREKKAGRKSVKEQEKLTGRGKNNNLNMEGERRKKKRNNGNLRGNDLKVEGKREQEQEQGSSSSSHRQSGYGRRQYHESREQREETEQEQGSRSDSRRQRNPYHFSSGRFQTRYRNRNGQIRVLEGQLDREVKELTFPGSAENIERLIKNQQQSYFANAQPQQQQQREKEEKRGRKGLISSI